MKIKFNIGLVVLLFSIVSSFIGSPIWFKWWMYLVLMMFDFKFSFTIER